MKKYIVFLILIFLLLSFGGCKYAPSGAEQTTALDPNNSSSEAALTTTEDLFEGESEIDFSDFETTPDTTENNDTEPASTEAASMPTEPSEPATNIPATDPTVDPVTTAPEITETTTTAEPSLEPDGYNNQIVRP